MAIIAFDVDGTLISFKDRPKEDTIKLLKLLHGMGNRIIVWSGGGRDYAKTWVQKLYLEDYVDEVKDKFDKHEYVDICFDDEMVDLAIINIKIDK